jgi:hypothetical protein
MEQYISKENYEITVVILWRSFSDLRSLELLLSFLKYIFRNLEVRMANSFGDHVIEISFRVRKFLDIHIPNCEKHLLPKITFLISRNSYLCPIWIFILDTDRAQIYSVVAIQSSQKTFC